MRHILGPSDESVQGTRGAIHPVPYRRLGEEVLLEGRAPGFAAAGSASPGAPSTYIASEGPLPVPAGGVRNSRIIAWTVYDATSRPSRVKTRPSP